MTESTEHKNSPKFSVIYHPPASSSNTYGSSTIATSNSNPPINAPRSRVGHTQQQPSTTHSLGTTTDGSGHMTSAANDAATSASHMTTGSTVSQQPPTSQNSTLQLSSQSSTTQQPQGTNSAHSAAAGRRTREAVHGRHHNLHHNARKRVFHIRKEVSI